MESQLYFCPFAGDNIILSDCDTAACRTNGFNNGLVFSSQDLQPGELFIVEIMSKSNEWNGNLRLGLTQIDLDIFQETRVPKQALPDLIALGRSWIYGITDVNKSSEICPWTEKMDLNGIKLENNSIETCRGIYSRSALRKVPAELVDDISPVSVGSRIGIVYTPVDDKFADLYMIINGNICGPVALDIPYKDSPLHVVVDVYGATQKVRIVQLYPILNLRTLCQKVIRRSFSRGYIRRSKLPNSLKQYILE